MHASTLGLFAVTELMLCLTPGPAVLLVLSQALRRGALRSFPSALGILAGNLFYFILSATSLGALLLASYRLFFAIKWLGAAYLIWLGISAFFGRTSPLSVKAAQDIPVSSSRLFLNGFVLQLANPKALLFFTAFLPQFINPAVPIMGQVAILAVTSLLIELTVLTCYGNLAGRATAYAAQPRFVTLTNRLAGSMLFIAGVTMASLRRP